MIFSLTDAPFKPLCGMKSPHLQTMITALISQKTPDYKAVLHKVALPDGDALALHEDCPQGWVAGGKVAILSHGLADDHCSPFLTRLVDKLSLRGVRVFRWDMRGCGAGLKWARQPYHAGCSKDLAAIVNAVIELCCPAKDGLAPDITIMGVSLSANVLLKYLGELPLQVPAMVRRAVAINPPINLKAGVTSIGARCNYIYNRYFTRTLLRRLKQWRLVRPDIYHPFVGVTPQTVEAFDNWFTAPAIGFRDADEYYRQSSAAQFIPAIDVPTTIITSRDDPFVPFEMFSSQGVCYPENVRLVAPHHGGHVGYIAHKGVDPDRRWIDWRVVEIVTGKKVC